VITGLGAKALREGRNTFDLNGQSRDAELVATDLKSILCKKTA
jgi:hypothetical protein